ncbi:MAG: hypothetical protein VX938_04930, partial [Myxococcota bacterium]|nr:hypothetical protein [Myxococcota bacterium]
GGGESEGDPMADCMPAILECAQPSNDAGTCGEFITCLDSGDDEEDEGMSAFLECIAGTGETAVGHFLTAQQCHESCFEQCDMGPVEGAPGPNPMACLETECASETDACTADIECEAAMFCMSICDGSEEDCEAQCQGALNDEEKALLDAVEACGNANGCLGSALEDGSQDEGACVAEYCGPELEACIADADCQAIFDCHEACDDDDDAADDCQAKCTEGVSAEALALFTATVECSLNAGCYSDPDDPAGGCVAAACETELTACIVDTECKGVMDCHDTCDEAEDADDACYSACLDGVSAASAALFDATVQCAIASDCWSEPGPGPGNCVGECLASDDCAPAMQACDMGPGPGPGPPPMD